MKEGERKNRRGHRQCRHVDQRLAAQLPLWRRRLLQWRLAETRRGAKAGIYGNDAVEATYPLTRNDADGRPLDGSKHNYTLTFPPVNCRRSTRSGR